MKLSDYMASKARSQERAAKRTAKRRFLPWGMRDSEKTKTIRVKSAPSIRERLIAQLDDLWAQIIKLRHRALFGPSCRICGRIRPLVAYHIVPKQRGHSIRWDLENGCGACSECNGAEMMNRSLYREKHIQIFGKELIERIETRARYLTKFDTPTLESMKISFRKIIEIGTWRKP